MKNSKFIVREFIPQDEPADRDALLPAFMAVWNAAENLKYLSPGLKPFDEDTVAAWFAGHKALGGRYFCALDDQGKILGILVVKITPIVGMELYGLGVRPECKGGGVGRALVEHCVDLALRLGHASVDVRVFADNRIMLKTLLSQDFVPVEMEYHVRADGADSVRLKKYLV